jgi:hypothetical protein
VSSQIGQIGIVGLLVIKHINILKVLYHTTDKNELREPLLTRQIILEHILTVESKPPKNFSRFAPACLAFTRIL